MEYPKGYLKHKKLAEDRFIKWEITPEEFIGLGKIRNDPNSRCAYTNAKFTPSGGNHATLERINENDSYNIRNVCFVTQSANQLKAAYIENGQKCPPNFQPIVTRIKRILSHPDNIRRIQEPYKHLFNTKPEETIMQNTEQLNVYKNEDITIATMYSAFGKQMEELDASFSLTFTEYKKLVSRKRCMLTNKTLPTNLEDRVLWVVDKTRPICRGNVRVCSKSTQKGLDFLEANANLKINDFVKLGKSLGSLK